MLCKEFFVGAVLCLGSGEVYGLARDEGQLAIDHGGADGASDGGEHEGEVYTRMQQNRANARR